MPIVWHVQLRKTFSHTILSNLMRSTRAFVLVSGGNRQTNAIKRHSKSLSHISPVLDTNWGLYCSMSLGSRDERKFESNAISALLASCLSDRPAFARGLDDSDMSVVQVYCEHVKWRSELL